MEIFFLRLGLTDLVDIGIVACILYWLYRYFRRTIGVQLFIGLVALYLLNVIVTAADMTMLKYLFEAIGQVFVLAIIILFQPEIRRLLLLFGQTTGIQRFWGGQDQSLLIDEVFIAIKEMSQEKTGALIVFTRNTHLDAFIETGTMLQAQMNADLLRSIFNKTSPLHDGAVIIQAQRIEAARCILPVTQSRDLSPHIGLRHRAALGLAEQSDALIVVVSEETGGLAIAVNGAILLDLSPIEVRNRLIQAFNQDNEISLTPAS
jgi:diadenylate cyclase